MTTKMNTDPKTEITRVIQVYKKALSENFKFLKQTVRLDDLMAKSIALPDEIGFLVPVCRLHVDDENLISVLSKWRKENFFAYPSQFEVTDSGTKSWLVSKLLDVEDRLLFLVVNKHGKPIGHLGWANGLNDNMEMEVDNVVRGEKEGNPGIMSMAMNALIDWAQEMIGPSEISLKVFSDNESAVNFYRKLGFQDDKLIPLRKHVEATGTFYRSIEQGDNSAADKSFLKMDYAPNRPYDGTKMILTAGPSISAREASYALDAARYGWNNQWSGYIKQFEKVFAEYIGVKHAISTSSCTGALHLALLGLGIKPGDEVIVPDITWVATANAVTYCGAIPIFADIQEDSWCLDPHSFESLITERTKAVIAVHLYGHPAQMDRIVEIARKRNIPILEDAAPSIGAEFKGQKMGTFGDASAFSFQGAKLLVTGEGGMFVTNNDKLYEKVLSLWDQGRDPSRMFWINDTGWKYKMSNVQAAIGLGQIQRSDELIGAKRRIFKWYDEGLKGVQGLKLNYETSWARSIYWMSSITLDKTAKISRDDLRSKLKAMNVDTRPVFPAISQYPIWPKVQKPQPMAKKIGDTGINLPSGVCLKHEQVAYVCESIRKILK